MKPNPVDIAPLVSMRQKAKTKIAVLALVIFAVSAVYYTSLAKVLPSLINIDNRENIVATKYITETKGLPTVSADDQRIRFTENGTTRLLRPPLTFWVSASAYSLTSTFIEDESLRLRLGSVLLSSLTVSLSFLCFWIAFRQVLLALLGTILIGLVPKYAFLSSTNNDDIGAILAVAALFTCAVIGHRHGPSKLLLILIAAALGLCFQAKFTAWLTLPWFMMFFAFIYRKSAQMVLRSSLVFLPILIVSGGWWILFNVINYGIDDPTATRQAESIQFAITNAEPNRQGYLSENVGVFDLLQNHDDFLTQTFQSAIGSLQWLKLELSISINLFYALIFAIGFIWAAVNAAKKGLFEGAVYWLICILCLWQIAFYLHHNLVRDIQAEGRYLLPLLVPIMFSFLSAISRIKPMLFSVRFGTRQAQASACIAFCLIVIGVTLHAETMTHRVFPLSESRYFHVKIEPQTNYAVDDIIELSGQFGLIADAQISGLTLTRTNRGLAYVPFTDNFCGILPKNAMITLNVYSITAGAVSLRLDDDKKRRFNATYWQTFAAGESDVVFMTNSRDCSEAKLSLGTKTHLITIRKISIAELKMHQHGTPI